MTTGAAYRLDRWTDVLGRSKQYVGTEASTGMDEMLSCWKIWPMLIVVTIPAIAKTPYPGDDWLLRKPGTKDEKLADDYARCIQSPRCPSHD